MYRCALAAIPVLACGGAPGPDPVAPAKVHHFHGRVVQANGAPRRGAVVVVSDPKGGDNRAMTVSGDDGTFVTELPLAAYAVTATTPDQSTYVASVDGTRAVEIRLEASCSTLSGRLESTSPTPPGAFIKITRHSDFIGDVFAVAPSADGSFQACLPPATYAVEAPAPHIVRDALVVLPHTGTFVYRTATKQDADRANVDLAGLAPASRDAFVAAFPATTRVLALGETNHGTAEFYDERTALVLKLAAKHGVRMVMLESGYAETLAIDDYVNGANVDIAKAVHATSYWMWDTKTFLRSLEAIRAYNAPLPPAKRIHVIGIDVQDTVAGVKMLGAVVSDDDRKRLEALAPNKRDAWNAVPAADRAAIRAILEPLAAKRAPGGSNAAANRLALVARALLMRIDLLEAQGTLPSLDVRDAGMARMVLDVLEHEPTGRATVWAHLGHVARDQMIGQRTMGANLATALGEGYRVYGLNAMSGAARAWDAKQEVGVVAIPLRVPPAGSLEAVLGAANGGAPVTYWTFAAATGDAARWVSGVHAMRLFGAVFPPGERDFLYWDFRGFDGVILFQSVTPTDPTPTGERRAKPK